MHIFLLGDLKSDNGPGNANKQIKKSLSLKYEVEFSKATGKIQRVFEMFNGIKNTDCVVVCSASNINYPAIKIAKKYRKKIVYLMHGYMSYEKKIENASLSEAELKKISDYEKFMFNNVDRIVCVSKRYRDFMRSQVPEYANKFDYIFNIVDTDKLEKISKKTCIRKKKNQVLSIGGGMKQKNVLSLAEAFDRYDKNIDFVVIGKSLSDGEKIRAFDNVTWYEHLKHEDLYRMLLDTNLYIQNSISESFGLSVIEALYAGCSLLVSNTIGCLDLFDTLEDEDIIFDIYNQSEIYQKAKYLLLNPNNDRLIRGLKKDFLSEEWQANKWQEIINSIVSV